MSVPTSAMELKIQNKDAVFHGLHSEVNTMCSVTSLPNNRFSRTAVREGCL